MNLWYWTSLVISARLTQGFCQSAGWCRTASHASGVRVQHHGLARVSRPQQASPEVSIWWPSGIPRGQAEVLEASWDLGWGSACNHTFTSAHLLAQVSYEANPRCRSWGNRLYLLIKGATESYLKGLDSKRRIIGAIFAIKLLYNLRGGKHHFQPNVTSKCGPVFTLISKSYKILRLKFHLIFLMSTPVCTHTLRT